MFTLELCNQLQIILHFTVICGIFVAADCTNIFPVWNRMSIPSVSGDDFPRARAGAAIWHDPKSKTVWMFGGQGAAESECARSCNAIVLDDFWMLNTLTGRWREIKRGTGMWPVGRHHAVACGKDGMVLIAGGLPVDGNEHQRSYAWRYSIQDDTWQQAAGPSRDVSDNGTRLVCSGNNLLVVNLGAAKSTVVWQYLWSKRLWTEIPRVGKARFIAIPYLTNLSSCPLWPAADGLMFVYAPISSKSRTDTEHTQVSYSNCIMWLLESSVNWTPLRSACELVNNCSKEFVPPYTAKNARILSPPCRLHAATWTDQDQNLWMFGGRGSDSNAVHDLWMYNLSSRSWLRANTSCKPVLCHSDVTMQCQSSPGDVIDSMVWMWNKSLFLFGGQKVQLNAGNVTYLADLWKMDVRMCTNYTLAVPPIGIFLISLSSTFLLSLGACIFVILAKCLSPLAPRIKPPVRTVGKVQYSAVSVDEVS